MTDVEALRRCALFKEFTETGAVFEDGSKLDADVFLFATGYGDPRNPMRDILGPELGKKLSPVWGIDEEGEIRGVWKDLGVENAWVMMGNFAWCRFYSKHLALRESLLHSGFEGIGAHLSTNRDQGEARRTLGRIALLSGCYRLSGLVSFRERERVRRRSAWIKVYL